MWFCFAIPLVIQFYNAYLHVTSLGTEQKLMRHAQEITGIIILIAALPTVSKQFARYAMCKNTLT